MSLSGRKAVVTGASRGIGRAIAGQLAADGAHVVCTSTREGGCDATMAEIEAAGGRSEAHALDLADASAIEAFGSAVLADGAPNILVNNAGITKDGSFLRMTAEDFDTVLRVNLRGTFLVCQAFVRAMLKADNPRIVNVGSIVGLVGNAGQANYAASKAGLVGLSRTLAKEFGPRGLTVNTVAPGFIETDMTAGLPDAVKDASRSSIALGRFGTPGDVAGAVHFLCSDAAAYVTGLVLVVDGGMTL